MKISDKEMRFLTKREKFVQAWPLVGVILICLGMGFGVWLFMTKPLLADPFSVLSMLKNDSIPASTLALMAALLPIAVLTCMALSVTIVLFTFSSFANEKKYLAMVQRIIDESTTQQCESEQVGVTQQDAQVGAEKPRC